MGSYALAFALMVLGSVVGGVVSTLVAAIAYGAVTLGEGVQDMASVLALHDGLGALGLTEGSYSTSAAAIYTMASYLVFIGIWIVFLIYLRASKRERPILGTITRRTAGNTPAMLGLGLLLGFVLNSACALGTTPVAGFAYDPGFGIEGSAMATVVLLVGCALVWWLGERRNVTPTGIWAGESAANSGSATAAGGAVSTGASAAENSSIS